MQKILVALMIVQVVSNTDRKKNGLKHLGNGYFEAYRLNPYNPLSYLIVIGAIPVIIVLYGFVGLFKQAENPFAWN